MIDTREAGVLAENLAADIAAELGASAGAGCNEADLVAYAAKAISDLTGSVALEALPEMAVRLATIRLTTARELVHPDASSVLELTARLNGGRPRPRRW